VVSILSAKEDPMVELQIRSPFLNEETNEVEWAVLTRLRVAGDTVEIEGDEGLLDFSVPVVSLRTGELLLFEKDREEWARNLPNAYRAGDYVVDVFRDDNPIPPEAVTGPELEREPIELRERVTAAAR
jgi:hypothetical protein